MVFSKVVFLCFMSSFCLTFLTTSSASAVKSVIQTKVEKSDYDIVSDLKSACFDSVLKNICMNKIHYVGDIALLCAAYLDVFGRCQKLDKRIINNDVNLTQTCVDLHKLYQNYTPVYLKTTVDHFMVRLNNSAQCADLCKVETKICTSLVYALQNATFNNSSADISEHVGDVTANVQIEQLNPDTGRNIGETDNLAHPLPTLSTNSISISEHVSILTENSSIKESKLSMEKNVFVKENNKQIDSTIKNDDNSDQETLIAPIEHLDEQDAQQLMEPDDDDIEPDVQMEQTEVDNSDKVKRIQGNDMVFKNEIGFSKAQEVEPFVSAEDSHLFSYLLCGMAICVLGYIIAHNKNKLLAFILEGRRASGGRGNRRRHTASYRKLDSNIEEAITSTDRSNYSQVIY